MMGTGIAHWAPFEKRNTPEMPVRKRIATHSEPVHESATDAPLSPFAPRKERRLPEMR